MNHEKKLKKLVCAVVILISASLLTAQAGRGKGRLAGFVVNEKGELLKDVKVVIEFYRDGNPAGLKQETVTNEKGEWRFIGLGSGAFMITTTADGYLADMVQQQVSQLDTNPIVKIVMREDPEKKARLHDEASMAILDQGNQKLLERNFNEALALFNEFKKKNPAVYQINFNIGDCYREMKEYDKAIEHYNLSIEAAKEKDDIDAQGKGLASIGETYLRQENFPKAQEYFQKSLALNPKDEVLSYNVAEIFFANGKVDDAIRYYKLATTIKPEWAPPYQKIGYSYLNKGEYASAIENFRNYLKYAPDAGDAPVVENLIKELEKLQK